jgi:hypothetical protein
VDSSEGCEIEGNSSESAMKALDIIVSQIEAGKYCILSYLKE